MASRRLFDGAQIELGLLPIVGATNTVTGTAAITEANDTASGLGTQGNTATGTGSVTESNDTASASGELRFTGTAAITESDDTASGLGTQGSTATGTAAITESDDTASGVGATDTPASDDTGGLPSSYSYFPEYHARQAEVKKAKTELQKVDSVLLEYERRRALAEESLRLAEESETQRLLKLQNELITEITRLLMVKADLMARVRRGEEQLILMIAMRRRRLRAF